MPLLREVSAEIGVIAESYGLDYEDKNFLRAWNVAEINDNQSKKTTANAALAKVGAGLINFIVAQKYFNINADSKFVSLNVDKYTASTHLSQLCDDNGFSGLFYVEHATDKLTDKLTSGATNKLSNKLDMQVSDNDVVVDTPLSESVKVSIVQALCASIFLGLGWDKAKVILEELICTQ